MRKLVEFIKMWASKPVKQYTRTYLVTTPKQYDKFIRQGIIHSDTNRIVMFTKFESALNFCRERSYRSFKIMCFTLPSEFIHNKVSDICEVHQDIEIDEWWIGCYDIF